MGVCDEWGGAESRGNGARPVEWMIMNDTCATHRSRVPRRSFGRNKRRSDDSGRRERTRPGFYFMFCVRQSSARGCRFLLCLVILLLKCLNVRRFPPPSSRIYELRYNHIWNIIDTNPMFLQGEILNMFDQLQHFLTYILLKETLILCPLLFAA